MAERDRRIGLGIMLGTFAIVLAVLVLATAAIRVARSDSAREPLAVGAPADFSVAQVLGGVTISAAELNDGMAVYRKNCVPCHGERGDGRGPSAGAMWPRPRDFRLGVFKFTGIQDRGLPDDQELFRVIRYGLPGSAMPPWDLPDSEIRSVLHYIKTFSLPGAGFRDGKLQVKRPVIPADPSPPGQREQTIARGRQLYHSYFECAKCHPAYAVAAEFAAWGSVPRADDLTLPVPKWSTTFQAVLVPPDFLRHQLRSVRADPALRGQDLYRVIAFGLMGPMPGYGHLGAADVWAVVHYVEALLDQRDLQK